MTYIIKNKVLLAIYFQVLAILNSKPLMTPLPHLQTNMDISKPITGIHLMIISTGRVIRDELSFMTGEKFQKSRVIAPESISRGRVAWEMAIDG